MLRNLVSSAIAGLAMAGLGLIPSVGQAQNNPVPWAEIVIQHNGSGAPMVVARTDARGLFRGQMNLPSGVYEIGVRCPASDACGRAVFVQTRVSVVDPASGKPGIDNLRLPDVKIIDLDTRANSNMGQMQITGMVAASYAEEPERFLIYHPPGVGPTIIPPPRSAAGTATPGQKKVAPSVTGGAAKPETSGEGGSGAGSP